MPTIRELVLEAEENFGTGRHGNSEQLFKRAAIMTLEQNIVPDGLYLSYRSLYDADKGNTPKMDQLKFIDQIQRLLLQHIIVSGTELLNQGNLERNQIVVLLELQQKSMKSLEMWEERDTIISTLVKEYTKLFETTKNHDYLINILDLQVDHEVLCKLLYQIYERALIQAEEGQFDGDLVAASIIIQHLVYVPEELRFKNSSTISKIITKCRVLLGEIISGQYSDENRKEDVYQMIKRYSQEWIKEGLE